MAVTKILVCGGRSYSNINKLYDVLDSYKRKYNTIFIIHGGAKGADSLAEMWARDHGMPVAKVEADWDYYGNSAGPVRNEWMLLLNPDLVVAFPGGDGTRNMISLALVNGVKVVEINE